VVGRGYRREEYTGSISVLPNEKNSDGDCIVKVINDTELHT
jgi:hypothetical protein